MCLRNRNCKKSSSKNGTIKSYMYSGWTEVKQGLSIDVRLLIKMLQPHLFRSLIMYLYKYLSLSSIYFRCVSEIAIIKNALLKMAP